MISLHQHSEFSLLDSIIKIPDLVAKAKSMRQEALALTDHGTIGGWVEFWQECRKQGIKPILGCEFYHSVRLQDQEIYHITMLAKDLEGARNIIKLHDMAYRVGFKKKPRITNDMIAQHGRGIIGLSGCLGSYMAQTALKTDMVDLGFYHFMREHLDAFFLEIQENHIPEQERVNQIYLKTGEQCVATLDCHVLEPEDYLAHKVALAIGYNKKAADIEYYKEEMYHYRDNPSLPDDAVMFTHKIASMVEEFDLGYDQWHFPTRGKKIDEDYEIERLRVNLETYLSEESMEDQDIDEQMYVDRLEYEFQVIRDNGFLEYFVTVADLCAKFDREGAFRGWGRGSASGSLVSFLYGITKIDPMKWGLIFERFLNPDRISPPDIDLDFRPGDKHRAIQYFRDVFGEAYQIGAYSTLGPKDAIQRAAKAMGVKTNLAKYVPSVAPVPSINKLMETDKPFIREANKNPEFRDVLLKIDGLKRNFSTHASGVVVSDGHLPCRINQTGALAGTAATVWDMYALEDMHHIKFDILGLTNLDLLARLEETTGIKVESIPLEDRQTFDLLCEGRTLGVFQWEGAGYTRLIVDLHPDQFSELLDTNTLYRPGPMESGLTQQYLDRKHGKERVTQLHPSLEMKSQGLPLYQEDIMLMSRTLAGFTMSEADTLRKAIGKKILSMFPALQAKWKEGCANNGIDEDVAMELWGMIEKFARYTWNKAHAVAYTLISYWSAYYSARYPVQFFAELFNISDSASRNGVIAAEASERGVKILHPDIKRSRDMAIPVENGVLLGINGIKYVGEKTVDKILKSQDDGTINKLVIKGRQNEYLTKAGVYGADKTTVRGESESLGFSISGDVLDETWWSHSCRNLGEVISKHKITTKKGDPMGFLRVRFRDRTESITVFPGLWSVRTWGVGDVMIFRTEGDILEDFVSPDDLGKVKVKVLDADGWMTFNPSIKSEPNILGMAGEGIGSQDIDEELLKFIELNFGIGEII